MIVLLVAWRAPTRQSTVLVLASLLAVQVAVEVLRLRVPAVNRAFLALLRPLVLPKEAGGPASSTWYTAGALVALAVLPRQAALSGILILALADPVASVVGQRWGRHPFLGGSWEGTVGFLVTALAILLARHDPAVAAFGAPLAALSERLSGPLDDNLVTPVASGAIVWLLWMAL